MGTAGTSTGTGGRACQNMDDRLYGNMADGKRETYQELAVHDQDHDSSRHYCSADLESQR